MLNTIHTIGHSTRELKDFIEMMHSFNIQLLADVRSYPGSKRYPHFNKENLAISLAEAGIEYLHMPELGGRRKPDPASINTAWRNEAFRGYADYMQSAPFIEGIKKLSMLAREKSTAIMCSEAVWWKCHRSLISDRMKLEGWEVMHIMEKSKSQPHPYTSPARVVQGKLFY
jgi:uncharacterized protein (DUF488 family)